MKHLYQAPAASVLSLGKDDILTSSIISAKDINYVDGSGDGDKVLFGKKA